MMSRKSKKGFSRLNTHEMVELNKNGQALDSGSESEILDLTAVDEREPLGGGCSSCCVWFTVLYVGLLTILVLLLGAFSGYILVNTWQMNQANNSTSNTIREDLEKLRGDFETHSKQTYYVLNGLKETTFSVNSSFSSLNMSVNTTLVYLVHKADEMDLRIKVLESHPREVLTQQIEDIHREMAVLNGNMRTLNQSLDELQAMREQMASMQSQIMSYESKMKDLSTTIGDTIHDNTNIQDTVQAFSDKILTFNDQLVTMESRMNQSNRTFMEYMNSTTTRFSEVQSLLSSLNESMWEEMSGMKDDINSTESELHSLGVEVSDLSGTVAALQNMPDTTDSDTSAAAVATPPAPPTATPPAPTTTPPTVITTEAQSDVEVSPRSTDNVATTSKDTDKTQSQTTSVKDSMGVATNSPPENPGDTNSVTEGEGVTSKRSTEPSTEEATETKEEEKEEEGNIVNSKVLQTLQGLYDNFENLDLDKNSVLDDTEFSHYLNSSKAFAALDNDPQDRELSKSEIHKAIEMFLAHQSVESTPANVDERSGT